MKKVFYCFIATLSIFISCSENDINEVATESETSYTIEKMARGRVSQNVFANEILGYGWQNVAQYRYNNDSGKFEEHDYFGRDSENPDDRPIGITPRHYYFHGNLMTIYTVATRKAGYECVHYDINCEYDKEKNILKSSPFVESKFKTTILFEELDGDQLSIIAYLGTDNNSRALYSRIILKRMSEETHNTFKEKYKIDL